MGILKDRLCDTHFQSAQFCQSAQAADAGVSRIGFLLMKKNWKNVLLYIVRIIELLITGAAGGALGSGL